jgi:hypothetical protein
MEGRENFRNLLHFVLQIGYGIQSARYIPKELSTEQHMATPSRGDTSIIEKGTFLSRISGGCSHLSCSLVHLLHRELSCKGSNNLLKHLVMKSLNLTVESDLHA